MQELTLEQRLDDPSSKIGDLIVHYIRIGELFRGLEGDRSLTEMDKKLLFRQIVDTVNILSNSEEELQELKREEWDIKVVKEQLLNMVRGDKLEFPWYFANNLANLTSKLKRESGGKIAFRKRIRGNITVIERY